MHGDEVAGSPITTCHAEAAARAAEDKGSRGTGRREAAAAVAVVGKGIHNFQLQKVKTDSRKNLQQ